MTRCHPNDIAEIIVSKAGNEGRRCMVLEPYDYVKHGMLHQNAGVSIGAGGAAWFVQPLQPLRCVSALLPDVVLSMDRCVFPDSWLRPIRDDDAERVCESEPVEVTA